MAGIFSFITFLSPWSEKYFIGWKFKIVEISLHIGILRLTEPKKWFFEIGLPVPQADISRMDELIEHTFETEELIGAEDFGGNCI